jgi:predicted O-methyltransferase YrrM
MSDAVDTAFPIASQTSRNDKQVLLHLRDILGRLPSYTFLEIGSFLGGSLTPFLTDAKCTHILSVDDRGRDQPDERGVTCDYTEVTHQTMLDNLAAHSLSTTKIETFDGSISEYPPSPIRYDFMFVDGEHTDWACFRDFVHGYKLLKPDAVVAFHDSRLIFKALRMIQELLVSSGTRFRFLKVRDCEMSVILLNDFCSVDADAIFPIEADLPGYYAHCETKLLRDNVLNRWGPLGSLKILPWMVYKGLPETIQEPIRKAYHGRG